LDGRLLAVRLDGWLLACAGRTTTRLCLDGRPPLLPATGRTAACACAAAKIGMRGDKVRMEGKTIFYGRERGGGGSVRSFLLDSAVTEKWFGVHFAPM
jgi:hypothetical protein